MTARGAALLAVFFLTLALGGVAVAQENETAGNETAPGGEAPADATGDATNDTAGGDAATYITWALDVDCPPGVHGEPCWTIETFPAMPGQTIELVADFTLSEVPHNLHVLAPVDQTVPAAPVVGGVHAVRFTVPEDFTEPIEFICDVHPETMVGFIVPPPGGAPGGAGGDDGHGIVSLGVHYLAYWVGVISFVALFVVYGLTFFLFKHGESNATTDHMDRPGARVDTPGQRMRAWVVVGVTTLLVAVGLVMTFMNMPAAG